jgi:hypothetical protein
MISLGRTISGRVQGRMAWRRFVPGEFRNIDRVAFLLATSLLWAVPSLAADHLTEDGLVHFWPFWSNKRARGRGRPLRVGSRSTGLLCGGGGQPSWFRRAGSEAVRGPSGGDRAITLHPARPPIGRPDRMIRGCRLIPRTKPGEVASSTMFVVTEADAAAIRAVFEQEGEFSAAIEGVRYALGFSHNTHWWPAGHVS